MYAGRELIDEKFFPNLDDMIAYLEKNGDVRYSFNKSPESMSRYMQKALKVYFE